MSIRDSVVHDLCRYIEAHVDEPLTLAVLARRAGYSPSHLQKAFKTVLGCSPRGWQQALRREAFKQALREESRVADAVQRAGYGSSSRIQDGGQSVIGMWPSAYRAHGAGEVLHYAIAETRLGPLLIGASAQGICFLQFGANAEAALRAEFAAARIEPMSEAAAPHFREWMQALDDFLSGYDRLHELPLDLRGTAFQIQVWNYLRTIPAGARRSYADVADALGCPASVRAVATACASNRVALAIPCHRVIRGDGHLAGYRWGLARKRELLALEAQGAD